MDTLPEMNEHYWGNLLIEVVNEPTYPLSSGNNSGAYTNVFFGPDAADNPVSKHGVKVFRNGELVNSCIVVGFGWGTSVHRTSSVVDANRLILCCGYTVFCLSLPELALKWDVQADSGTCLQVLQYKNDYLIHGEFQITRLNTDGHVKWTFSGADIFVSVNGKASFILEPDGIRLRDFNGGTYKIDFDGKLL